MQYVATAALKIRVVSNYLSGQRSPRGQSLHS
jgi:hypothetical protein